MPTIPQLPAASTMVLRPNHEAFFDECIGAPVAKCSTMSLKSTPIFLILYLALVQIAICQRPSDLIALE